MQTGGENAAAGPGRIRPDVIFPESDADGIASVVKYLTL